MKVFVAIACIIALAVAEPPPSNSYLPPSTRGSNGGYPSGGPQVVAARSQGFSRNAGGHGQGFNGNQGYDHNAAAFGRNGEAGGEPANYNFGYMVNDEHEGTDFGHHEERLEDSAHGEYHVVLPDGRRQTVSYEADERGFKPHVSYEDEASSRNGGYDGNAQNGGHGHHGNGFNGRSSGYN